MQYLLLYLFALLLLLLVIFSVTQNGNQTDKVTRVNQDTIFKYEQYGKILRYFQDDITITRYAIHLSGIIDNEAEIYFRYKNSYEKFYSIIIPKGKIDTTCQGDYYATYANIVYDHKSVKKGPINIILGFNWSQ